MMKVGLRNLPCLTPRKKNHGSQSGSRNADRKVLFCNFWVLPATPARKSSLQHSTPPPLLLEAAVTMSPR